jgi:hypothetical protein
MVPITGPRVPRSKSPSKWNIPSKKNAQPTHAGNTLRDNSRQFKQDNANKTHSPHLLNRLDRWHSNDEQDSAKNIEDPEEGSISS